ncbi:MAG TPA: DUF2298 domain-containing protein [Ktedonobacterales bacterium]|nr:DUF2298 domain-containing protein [Ktedonobacterales bacterium]
MGLVLLWWVAIEVVGLAALPLTTLVFARLPGRGWAFAKPLGLLTLGWLIWFPLIVFHALPYSSGWIAGTLIAFALGNVALMRRLPAVRAGLVALWREQRAYIIGGEAVFAGAFALMAWVRAFTPAVVDTEKFMDVAFISSLWRTPHLPAPDPWLSGNPINYYYFGHFLIASLAKMLGTQPGTAFNLGVALIFALSAVAIFGVVTSVVAVLRGSRPDALRRAMPYGLFSLCAVLILGNLNSAQIWWNQARALLKYTPALHGNVWMFWLNRNLWTQYDWWSPSRVVPSTINEFPAFSFVLADLHAHVLALPFAALAVALAFNLLVGRGQGLRVFGAGRERWLVLGVTALAIGGLYAINGWDLPTYLGLAALGLAVQQWLAHGRRLTSVFALDLCAAAGLLIALCFILYLPFYRGFVSPSAGVKLVPPNQRSAIGYEFAIFGLPLVIVASLLFLRVTHWVADVVRGRDASSSQSSEPNPPAPFPRGERGAGDAMAGGEDNHEAAAIRAVFSGVIVAIPLVALLLWTVSTTSNLGWTLFWCVLLVLACFALVVRHLLPDEFADEAESSPVETTADLGDVWLYVLVGVSAALVAAAELVYLRDIFDSRMNTVFKLYYQAWLLLGLAAGVALARLLPAARATLAAFIANRAPATMRVNDVDERPASLAAPRFAIAGAARGSDGGKRPDSAWNPPTGNRVSQDDDAAGENSSASDAPPARGRAVLPEALRWIGAGGILVWTGVVAVLVCASLIYPVLATSARTNNFTARTGLDGTAYMASDPVNGGVGCASVGAGSNHDDNEAIAWLNKSVSGSPVILEAPGCEWSHYSRVSSFTGMPTLLGWPGGHEGEWRVNWVTKTGQQAIFAERADAIQTIYTSQDQATVLNLLRQYHVRYVYVGAAERQVYPNANLARFGIYLTVVYQHDGVIIYSVPSK